MKRSIVLLLTILSFSATGYGQSVSLPDPEPYFAAIIVDDINASINWYKTNLGFEVLNKAEMKERGFSQANLKRGEMLVELIELESAVSKEELLETNPGIKLLEGFFKIGFRIDNFDGWVEFLESSEVEFKGSVVVDPNSGKKMVLVLDPDGNRIQLFEK